jgi:hypothetical protein
MPNALRKYPAESNRECRGLMSRAAVPTGFSFQDALPEMIRSASLFVLGYFLLRWLYFKPLEDEPGESLSEQDT